MITKYARWIFHTVYTCEIQNLYVELFKSYGQHLIVLCSTMHGQMLVITFDAALADILLFNEWIYFPNFQIIFRFRFSSIRLVPPFIDREMSVPKLNILHNLLLDISNNG